MCVTTAGRPDDDAQSVSCDVVTVSCQDPVQGVVLNKKERKEDKIEGGLVMTKCKINCLA